MKFVYNNKLECIEKVHDEVEDEVILNLYPGTRILNEYIEYPKLEDNNIISMNNEEIQTEKYRRYNLGKYTLTSNEIIENEKIKEIVLKEFEYIENGILKFDFEAKRKSLLEELEEEETKEYNAPVMYKGLYHNAKKDDVFTLSVVKTEMLAVGQTKRDAWIFFNENGERVIRAITVEEMSEIIALIETQKNNTLMKYGMLKIQISNMSEEELRMC